MPIGTNHGTTGIRIVCAGATRPEVGLLLVLDPGDAAKVEVINVVSVTEVSGNTVLVKSTGGTTARLHAVGAAVKTSFCNDMTHPTHALQNLTAIEAVVPWKGTI